MGLFSKIFGNRAKSGSTRHDWPDEYKRVQDFNHKLALLLGRDRFIARSDYASIVSEYSELPVFFDTLEKSGMLSSYSDANGLDKKIIKEFRCTYSQLSDITSEPAVIKAHNDAFIQKQLKEQKKYLDNILKECDPNIMLDDEQREVVLSDEDHTLVIAGAGAGKTTTVAAKVRSLVEKQGVKPEEILVISFTNKAVNELKERINHNLNIPCPISTFHSIGNSIMNTHEDGRKRIVDNGYMFNAINRYLKDTVLRDSELVDKLILFFGSYFTAPYEGDNLAEYFQFISSAEFSTIKSNAIIFNRLLIVKPKRLRR